MLRRGQGVRRIPQSIRLNPVWLIARRSPALQQTTRSRFYCRVWERSIVGCGKLVKRKTARDHKISGCACRSRLLVVVWPPNFHYNWISGPCGIQSTVGIENSAPQEKKW